MTALVRLGRFQTIALVAIGNGYRTTDRADKVLRALADKRLLTWLDGRDGGWVLTDKGTHWLNTSRTITSITSTTYYLTHRDLEWKP